MPIKNRIITLRGRDFEEIVDSPTSDLNIPSPVPIASVSIPTPGRKTGTVIFRVQPNISESGGASYFEVSDIRQAASVLIYQGSPSREFSIQGKFVSRTEAEAAENWAFVQRLRSWRLPEKTASGVAIKAPSRLTLSGFGNWFNNITVRMTNLSIESPEDVDYIRAPNGKDIPIVWPVSVTLKEAKSVDDLKQFNIQTFREGSLDGW